MKHLLTLFVFCLLASFIPQIAHATQGSCNENEGDQVKRDGRAYFTFGRNTTGTIVEILKDRQVEGYQQVVERYLKAMEKWRRDHKGFMETRSFELSNTRLQLTFYRQYRQSRWMRLFRSFINSIKGFRRYLWVRFLLPYQINSATKEIMERLHRDWVFNIRPAELQTLQTRFAENRRNELREVFLTTAVIRQAIQREGKYATEQNHEMSPWQLASALARQTGSPPVNYNVKLVPKFGIRNGEFLASVGRLSGETSPSQLPELRFNLDYSLAGGLTGPRLLVDANAATGVAVLNVSRANGFAEIAPKLDVRIGDEFWKVGQLRNGRTAVNKDFNTMGGNDFVATFIGLQKYYDVEITLSDR